MKWKRKSEAKLSTFFLNNAMMSRVLGYGESLYF